MLDEKVKANRIIKEMTSYFLINHIYNFDMNFHIDKDELRILYTAKLDEEPETFREFIEALSVPRQVELEEHFNGLLGAHSNHHNYSFLGQSIDEVEGKFEDGILSVFVKRIIY